MIEHYQDMVTGKPPYSIFQVKQYDCVITLYESGKVMFQGIGADIEASYWTEQESTDYTCDETKDLILSEELVNKLHDAFSWSVWRNMEKWQLLRSLILSTWGPDEGIPNSELSELERYGIINKD